VPAPEAAASAAGDAPEPAAVDDSHLLAWMLGGAPPEPGEATADERRLLAQLDAVLAQGEIADVLLPRATAFVPQLMALLRQGDATVASIAERIAQDAPLAAEVLRVATSVAQGGMPVQDLAQAVQRIGSAGVQRAVARVVFRPMYAGSDGSLGARAAPWLWLLAERCAEGAAARAAAHGLPAFDGYLGGLLHGTGWTVALRIADRAGLAVALPQSHDGAAALAARAHRLFGLASRRWQITPGFAALGEDAVQTPWAESALPLALCLREAQAAVLASRPA
jgi:hypothetical protein